jgi:hypothetical protein
MSQHRSVGHKMGAAFIPNFTQFPRKLFGGTLFQLYPGGQFYWCRKPDYPVKTIDLPQVTDKPYHIMLLLSGIRSHNDSGDRY